VNATAFAIQVRAKSRYPFGQDVPSFSTGGRPCVGGSELAFAGFFFDAETSAKLFRKAAIEVHNRSRPALLAPFRVLVDAV
jgi:hypothetical protein